MLNYFRYLNLFNAKIGVDGSMCYELYHNIN